MRRAPARRGTALTQKQKGTSSGDRTHDHKIKSLALYHLSYGGLSDVGLVRAGFEPHRPVGSNPMEPI